MIRWSWTQRSYRPHGTRGNAGTTVAAYSVMLRTLITLFDAAFALISY